MTPASWSGSGGQTLGAASEREEHPYRAHMENVVVTEDGVSRRARRLLRRDINETIAWRDLHRVEVVSRFAAAAKDDVYFLLVDENERGVAVGLSDALATGLFSRLQRLPGFDNEAATAAAGAEMRAVLWRLET